MLLIVLGVVLWAAAHMYKRIAPGSRAALEGRLGRASRGVIALSLVIAVALMIAGYRRAEFVPLWLPPEWTVHLNNLLMLVAVALFGLGQSKSRLRGTMRHPQLTGFILWCIAHLLVNGDMASILLWGGLLIWAAVEIGLLNATTEPPARYRGGSLAGDIRLAVITLVVFAVISGIHAWLGVWPFPR